MSLFGLPTEKPFMIWWQAAPLQSTREANLLALKFQVNQTNTEETNTLNYIIRNIQIEIDAKIKVPTKGFSKNHLLELSLHVCFQNLCKNDDYNFNSLVLSSRVLDVRKKVTEDNVWHYVGKKEFYDTCEFDLSILLGRVPEVHAFPALYNDNEFADLELHSTDGSVRLHRAVLAAWSPVLNKLCSNSEEFKELTAKTSITTLQNLKEYMYLHELPDGDSDLQDLLLFASKYILKDLEQNCADKLVNNLTKNNAIELFKFAAEHNYVSIISDILEFSYYNIAVELRKEWIESLIGKCMSNTETDSIEQNWDDITTLGDPQPVFGVVPIKQLWYWDVELLESTRKPNILNMKFTVRQTNKRTPNKFTYVAKNLKIELNMNIKPINENSTFGQQTAVKYELSMDVRLTQVHKDIMNFYNQIKLSSHSLGFDKEIKKNDDWCLVQSKIFSGPWDLDLEFTLNTIPKIQASPAIYDDEEFTDFELRGEGGSVAVHRAVVAAWSPVIKTMLSGNWRETNVGHTDVSDTSRDTLQHLKEYMYLHKLPDSDADLQELLLFASSFMIPELEQNCADKLVNSISKDNALELFEFTATHNQISLMADIFEYPLNEISTELRKHFH